MSRPLAWLLASLLGLFHTSAWAQPAKGSAQAKNTSYPPLRLAGPAPPPGATATEATATAAPPAAATAAPAPAPTAAAPSGSSATAATPTPASPAPPADEALDSLAQHHYRAGAEMYQSGQYEAARIEFEAAYKILPLPDLLHNLSMVAEQQGRFAEAVGYEERFFAAASNLIHAERAVVRTRIAKLREQAGMPPSSSVPATTETPVASAPSERRRTPKGALVLIGIGGGMLLAGIGCGAGAVVTQGSLENGQPLYLHEIDALTTRGQALSRAGISLDVAGGLAIVVGSAWAIVAKMRKRGAAK